MTPILGIIASQNYPRITNSYESIATQTVGAGGAASVTFSSIPSTFKHLQIRGIARDSAADTGVQNVVMSLNSDTTYTNYRTHYLLGDGATPDAGSIQVSGFYTAAALAVSNNATASIYGATVIDILDYADTNKNKTLRVLAGIDLNGVGGQMRLQSSVWLSTSAVTSCTINVRSAGNLMQYSQFALYGIKG
jgi:hypothetical protein